MVGVNSRPRIFDFTKLITLAAINFRFTPEVTLNMSYPLLMHMLDEYVALNMTDEEKQKGKKEIKLGASGILEE